MNWICGWSLVLLLSVPLGAEDGLRQSAIDAMRKAGLYFRTHVATNGGYLWAYKTDFTMRQGEGVASPSMIWVQPPGTPAVGMAFLKAYQATGDSLFLNGAIEAARALLWGQLASGGWDYRIDFDPEESKKWHYRRDVEKGDSQTAERRNRTTLDDNNTQSALQLLMRVDKLLNFADKEIHRAVEYGLNALLKAQYPNGAWPQRFSEFPDPQQFPVIKAHYPKTWSRQYSKQRYLDYYTFNDNAISDLIKTMVEAYKTYGDNRYLEAAQKGGDFILLAQMPDPQPAWAQQYNLDMEPAWARKFEPPAITGGESYGVLRILLELYLEFGEERFLAPIPKALAWAKGSLLADGRMARFYELQTNTPLYFSKDYLLTYDDSDMPTHYAFKVGNWTERIENTYKRIRAEGRQAILAERTRPSSVAAERIEEIINALDREGRWVEEGNLRNPDNRHQPIVAQVLSCRTFQRNLTTLAQYVQSQ